MSFDLNHISTHWASLSDSTQFVTRYGKAVRAYLRALLPSQDDADDVEQEFLLKVVSKGFPTATAERGHFRHYLIAVVRNAAYAHLRSRANQTQTTGDLVHLPADSSANQHWQEAWRECVLQSTWHALRNHQKRHRGNLFFAVLRAAVDHPKEASSALAVRVSRTTGQPMSAEAFRKQLSRARQRFKELLIEEVARTLSQVTPELLEEELRDLDLWKYVHEQVR